MYLYTCILMPSERHATLRKWEDDSIGIPCEHETKKGLDGQSQQATTGFGFSLVWICS